MDIPVETPEGGTRIPVEETKNIEKVAVELEYLFSRNRR